jgi:[acyl-carrier-protein] S-malonyltransferase
VANDNAPGQVVISGAKAAIDRAMALSKDYGARRAIPLPVSAPFHCALMQPAAERMASALAEVTIKAPAVPVIANVLAQAIRDPQEIRRRLVEQVTGAVRWRESVAYMAEQGVRVLYEIGAGRVLTGLVRRIDDRLDGRAIGTAADIASAGQHFAVAV